MLLLVSMREGVREREKKTVTGRTKRWVEERFYTKMYSIIEEILYYIWSIKAENAAGLWCLTDPWHCWEIAKQIDRHTDHTIHTHTHTPKSSTAIMQAGSKHSVKGKSSFGIIGFARSWIFDYDTIVHLIKNNGSGSSQWQRTRENEKEVK